jgi:hypothetical protein
MLIGIVVVMLVALVAGGTTLAAASPTAVAAKKHHKKKKATSCTGTAGLSGSGIHYFDADVHCNGTFSKLKVTTNKPIEAGTARAHAFGPGQPTKKLSCQSGTNTITCTGVPARARAVQMIYQSMQACAPPMVTSSATVNGKTFSLPASCL